MSPPPQPLGARRPGALLVVLLLVALLGAGGLAAASTSSTGAASPGVAPSSPPDPPASAPADAWATPTESIDPSTAVPSTDADAAGPTEAPTGSGGGTVTGDGTDAVDAATNATTNTRDATTTAVNGTTNGTGDLLNESPGALNASANVSGGLGVAGDDANASAAPGSAVGGGQAADEPTPVPPPPTETTPEAAGSGGTEAAAVATEGGSSPEPVRGGGLPGAAGGAAALGLATVAGAALLHRSPALADGTAWSSARTGLAELRRGDAGPGEWLRWVLWSVGYSRYDDSDPLAHDTRAALYRRIEDAPGVYLTALADDLVLPLSTARHHLRVLTAESLVTTSMIRGKRRYFPVATEDEALQAAMADETQTNVLSGIARRGGATVTTLARDLDRDASTITSQLQHLAEADLVERERDGRQVWNRLAPHVEPYFEDAGAESD